MVAARYYCGSSRLPKGGRYRGIQTCRLPPLPLPLHSGMGAARFAGVGAFA